MSRDAFAGGFVAGIVGGKSLDESIDMGHWLASLSIKELGPSYVNYTPISDVLFPFHKQAKADIRSSRPDNLYLLDISISSASSVIHSIYHMS